MTAAELTMEPTTRALDDRVQYDKKYLPLPITHKGFTLGARTLAASRTSAQPLDTTQVALCTTLISEFTEKLLFNGSGTYTFGGGVIYGYLDHPQVNSYTLAANWDDSAADPVADVIGMKQALIDAKHFGPYIVYYSTNFETAIDADFKAASDKTIKQRIMEIGSIADVKVSDHITTDRVVVVQLQPTTVRMVIGMQPQVIEWSNDGGMTSHFKVMSIMVPQIRADQANNCGVAVGAA
jgi:uncharacterized linocin/CFP29 family protein